MSTHSMSGSLCLHRLRLCSLPQPSKREFMAFFTDLDLITFPVLINRYTSTSMCSKFLSYRWFWQIKAVQDTAGHLGGGLLMVSTTAQSEYYHDYSRTFRELQSALESPMFLLRWNSIVKVSETWRITLLVSTYKSIRKCQGPGEILSGFHKHYYNGGTSRSTSVPGSLDHGLKKRLLARQLAWVRRDMVICKHISSSQNQCLLESSPIDRYEVKTFNSPHTSKEAWPQLQI